MTYAAARRALHAQADPSRRPVLQSFFKTGPGEYAEGDVFIGVTVPRTRAVAKGFLELPQAELKKLLRSRIHEERLLGLVILVHRYRRAREDAVREGVMRVYLAHTKWINNWDLVDLTAPYIVGAHLLERDRKLLYRLVRSRLLWERRIAIVATLGLIRERSYKDCLRLCALLLDDEHDLMHKACGWMLREVGKREVATLRRFLDAYGPVMPRTMLRYAIERFPERERRQYLERPSRRLSKGKRKKP